MFDSVRPSSRPTEDRNPSGLAHHDSGGDGADRASSHRWPDTIRPRQSDTARLQSRNRRRVRHDGHSGLCRRRRRHRTLHRRLQAHHRRTRNVRRNGGRHHARRRRDLHGRRLRPPRVGQPDESTRSPRPHRAKNRCTYRRHACLITCPSQEYPAQRTGRCCR